MSSTTQHAMSPEADIYTVLGAGYSIKLKKYNTSILSCFKTCPNTYLLLYITIYKLSPQQKIYWRKKARNVIGIILTKHIFPGGRTPMLAVTSAPMVHANVLKYYLRYQIYVV